MAILLSIRPEYVEKILNGEKTIEIRKTKPKCELPCKVYIYCTKPKKWWRFSSWGVTSDELLWKTPNEIKMCDGFKYWAEDIEHCRLNGRVVAEFTLDTVDKFSVFENGSVQNWNYDNLEKSCLTYDEIANYVGKGKTSYAWHISDLKIYDKPKELSEFKKMCDGFIDCLACKRIVRDDCDGKITRPPQSWCYVEE